MKLSLDEITWHLELEAQEAWPWDSIKEGEKLLAVKQKKMKGATLSTKCTNYQWPGHTIEKCWEEEGGDMDKASDWWKTVKEKQNGQKGKKKKKEEAHTV